MNSSLKNWIPYQLFFENDEASCKWLCTENVAFNKPFFIETIMQCQSAAHVFNPKKLKVISNLTVLSDWVKQEDTIEPTAFIFHVSRCGSTLASQSLSISEKNISLAEVPFFNELLLNQHKIETAALENIFKAAVNLYGNRKNGVEENLFIKTDSWHLLFYQQLRKWYPQTPFFLLYRKPDEVLQSHQKKRGIQTVPGLIHPALFGFDEATIMQMSLDEYAALVLEKYYECFATIAATDKNAYLINYHAGTFEMVTKITELSNVFFTTAEFEAMEQRLKYHSKYPETLFSETMLPVTVPAYLEKTFAYYYQLEAMR